LIPRDDKAPGKPKAVFLDRDGVLNHAVLRDGKPYPPANAAELSIVPEAASALALLRRQGYRLLVVTNQPDVARGTQQRSEVEAIHAVLAAALPIDDFFVCYHDDADCCACRKPKPGLLLQAAEKYNLSLPDCYLIGDRWRDIDAAHAAGCRAVWLNAGYRERGPSSPPAAEVTTLAEAANWIAARAVSA
jgi:D-glycero-D-manno-heptose 1,7-bisphosphate phosphatase